MPRVSICIPAYNAEYFEVSLRSAIGQSFSDTEIIVSDDCRTEAIKEICDRFPGLVSYSRNPSPGALNNILRLINMAQGEYIKFVFDDDVLNPFCVQYLFEALENTRQHNTNLAFSPRYFIDGNGHVTGLSNPFNSENGMQLLRGADFIRQTALVHHNLIGEYTTVLFRKADCFDADGRFRFFDPDGYDLPDLNAWLDLAGRGNFVIHSQPLSYFRQHDQATSNPANSLNFVHCILYYEKVLKSAMENGFITGNDIPASYQKLIGVYRYWEKQFPELTASIQRFEAIVANPALAVSA